MNIKTFIADYAAGNLKQPRDGRRYVASVLFDGEKLYSYGTHYPLLFKVGEHLVCNDRGYSNTTARHISYVRQYADYCVKLPRYTTNTAADTIKAAALAEITENEELIAEALERQIKRPRYEATYQRTIDRAEDRIQQLKALITVAEAAL